MDFHCLSGKKIYSIVNSFECEIEIDGEGFIKNPFPSELVEFHKNLVESYLRPLIRLMRLFKEGNISIPVEYYFFIDNKKPKLFMSASRGSYISAEEPYALENSEILDLNKYNQNTKLPFTKPFLQLAFDNFELSYQTQNTNLSFLSLIISLETLFNPGEQELKYSISRNTAVLLGMDREDAKTIFKNVKRLYKKRSQLVHSGKSKISQEDLLLLRHYVRESIKEVYKIGKNKDELLEKLNLCGFGERSWAKTEGDEEGFQTK
jgi:lysyl-tRNA synthetase class I